MMRHLMKEKGLKRKGNDHAGGAEGEGRWPRWGEGSQAATTIFAHLGPAPVASTLP
jgi:hypothetical protein